ncbi:hypothetical protein VNO77_06464 [Canavalia gladiata]|uniref:Late embryogenesis abundant protein LEA-2 subgroup domain-containing protein n=1 Tax=Canavalia gladiata TaxID=3824 RepID=A0AAN9QSX9_CANGL
MTDRVHPSANGGKTATFPATKSQLYGATRPSYCPQPYHQRRSSSRGWCCSLCLCLILILLFLLLLIGGAGTVAYFLYHPQRPSFSVTSLKLSYLKLTSSSTLNSKFELKLSATNPNNKIVFSYDPTSVSILSNEDIDIAHGTIPSFRHSQRNITILKVSIASSEESVESDAAMRLKGIMKSNSGLALKVKLETKVQANMGVLHTPSVPVTAFCDGVAVTLPDGDKPATASIANTECNVDVRFKIWKWTVG